MLLTCGSGAGLSPVRLGDLSRVLFPIHNRDLLEDRDKPVSPWWPEL